MSALTQAAPDLVQAFSDEQIITATVELDDEVNAAHAWVADLQARLAHAEREAARLTALDRAVTAEGAYRGLF